MPSVVLWSYCPRVLVLVLVSRRLEPHTGGFDLGRGLEACGLGVGLDGCGLGLDLSNSSLDLGLGLEVCGLAVGLEITS